MPRNRRGDQLAHLVGFVISTAIWAISSVVAMVKKAYAKREFKRAAHRLGLRRANQALPGYSGERDGQPVSFELRGDDPNRPDRLDTHIEVGERHPAFASVSMTPKRWTERLLGSLTDAIATGDQEFDRRYTLRGPREKVYRLFGPGVRRRALEAVEDPFGLDEGRVVYEIDGIATGRQIVPRVLRAVSFTRAIEGELEDSRRLVDRYLEEPKSVRRTLLEWAMGAGGPTAQGIRDAALEDPEADLRIIAARSARSPEALITVIRDAGAPDTLRAEAFQSLRHRAPDAARPLIREILGANAAPLRIAAANAARDLDVVEALPAVRQAVLNFRDPPTIAALAAALGALGDAEDAPGLVRWVDHRDGDLQIAVIEALGRIGTVEQIPPLHALTTGLLAIGRVPTAAKAAVQAIQSRLGDVGAGRLAVADAAEGRLSEVQAGELTLPEE